MSHQHTASAGSHRRCILPATLVAIAAATLLTACGRHSGAADAGPWTTEQRPVAGVHAVDLRTSGDLTIAAGAAPKLTITAGSATLRNLTSEVHDGTVVLASRPGRTTTGEIHYVLTVPAIDELMVAGSGSAHGDIITSGSFSVTVAGSGSAVITGVTATAVRVSLTGSGDLNLAGTTSSQRVDLAGSGTYNGTGLASSDSEVQVDGSGNARVVANQRLDARIGGSGNIGYTGTPALTTHVSGSGTIHEG